MHITNLELNNIKSHASASFDFAKGTTAITGHNGAGKTTIIEAIAWTLFDFLNYRKEDFVRHGEKKGSAVLTFVSGLDEREYVIYRDTNAGWYVTDPRLQTKIANKKEEVYRFLWQHLGLEPGTDLESLYKQAIGVPQGTFTAIFLESPTERKAAFERLLKVEEYRLAAEKLKETARYLDNSVASARESIARAEGELSRSDAVEEEHRGYEAQITTLAGEITTLDVDISVKSSLVAQLDEAEKLIAAIKTLNTDRQRWAEGLNAVDQARVEIANLESKVAEQQALETSIAYLREKIAAGRAITSQVASLEASISRLRQSYAQAKAQLVEAEEKSAYNGNLESELAFLTKDETRLITALAGCRADIAQAAKFQTEIANGLCPILSAKCLNLNEGETLATFMSNKRSDVSELIGNLETEQLGNAAALRQAREAERFTTALEGLRQREADLKAEGIRLTEQKDELAKQTADLAGYENELTSITGRLATLNDPRSRVRVLESAIARETEYRDAITEIDTKLADLEPRVESLVGETGYHPDRHQTERSTLRNLETQQASKSATLDAARRRQAQLAAEITRFSELRTTLAAEFKAKESVEKTAETTQFIRNTLKEAAPRVARNYVHRVSLEAGQMFREITGNAEQTLSWAEDYSIVLEEEGFKRPFSSLSGGEQMAAALSVRLALLKQLTDIRIAFFDEPTTNMDAERRENLAEQIGRITNFDQLFVISHDDTFENAVDNVLTVERGV